MSLHSSVLTVAPHSFRSVPLLPTYHLILSSPLHLSVPLPFLGGLKVQSPLASFDVTKPAGENRYPHDASAGG
jgi:hypothetical protein